MAMARTATSAAAIIRETLRIDSLLGLHPAGWMTGHGAEGARARWHGCAQSVTIL
jgi:hypothetical protein